MRKTKILETLYIFYVNVKTYIYKFWCKLVVLVKLNIQQIICIMVNEFLKVNCFYLYICICRYLCT